MQRDPGMWGIGGDPTPRRLSGTAKGSEPRSQGGRQGTRGRGRRAPESFRHIPASTLPATRPKGTLCPAPNVGSRPLLRSPADEGRVLRISQDDPHPPPRSRPVLAATLPPPPPRPSGRLPPAGAAAGLPRSRARSSAIPPGPAAAGRAAGIVAAGRSEPRAAGRADGAGAGEGGRRRARKGRRRQPRGGGRGPGQPPEPPGADARSAPRSLWPSCAGRGRASEEEPASERANERGAGGRREGAGAESVPSERGQEGRGRAGPGCQPPPVAAGPSALQSLTPVPLASWGPRASSRWMLRQPCAGATRLKSVRTIFQTVRWRPPS